MLSAALIGSEIEFEIAGPVTESALWRLSLNLVLVLGTVKLLLPEERSRR